MKRMSIAVLALVAMPALAAAQDTTRQQTDTMRAGTRATQDTAASRTGTSRGRRGTGRSSMGLSHDQVMQLQTALSGAGCDAGTADGILGPKTRRAMACARQKNNVATNADLYRALNLDFPSSGTSGTSGGARRSEGRSPANATRGDSTRTPTRGADSTRRDSTRRDTTRRVPPSR